MLQAIEAREAVIVSADPDVTLDIPPRDPETTTSTTVVSGPDPEQTVGDPDQTVGEPEDGDG